MDAYTTYTADRPGPAAAGASGEDKAVARSFLFLQGPISGFFDRLGRALIARGHRVARVNLHFGDRLFWRLPATDFRGRFADWREFVGDLMDRHQVTDLVLHGDRRPYHIIAAEEARARGIAVVATDLGYVRPDWLTLEYDGLTTYSRFPRDPAAIRSLAAELPEPESGAAFHTPFWLIASRDVAYNLGLVFGRPFFPHYRYHSTVHPFAEYAGWLWSRPRKLLAARATAAAKARLQQAPGSYFLVPLQLSTDFQIRAHSPFVDLRDAVREMVRSFAASGSRRKLVFVVHPLDNGLIDWHWLIGLLAREGGAREQVLALHGGTPIELLRNAAGVVTVNSTVGVTALALGVPVKALGNAVFVVPGLTSGAPLDDFWHDPSPPEPGLPAAFLRALIGTTQVRGGYYQRGAQERAIAGFVERLEHRPYELPPLTAVELAARAPRADERAIVITGGSNPHGIALARHFAAPGVRLTLIGAAAETLARAAADCRQRGALVETFCPDCDGPSTTAVVAAFDRRFPVDLLVAQGEAERDLRNAMDAVAALAEPMRRRGRGAILLAGGMTGAVGPRAVGAWLAYATALRRRLRGAGIFVGVAAPRCVALRLTAWLRVPALASEGADRVAELIDRGLCRRRRRIVLPGTARLVGRGLRRLPSRAGVTVRDVLLPVAAELADAVDEAPLAEKSGIGD
jgi:capsular polysaccharide export protein